MNRKTEVITGAFVLLGTLLIAGGALWLSGDRWRAAYRELSARFVTVGQLREGNQVSVQGVRVGRVEEIRLTEEGQVVVRMRLREDAPLPPDPVAVLRSSSLFGDWEVAIVPGRTRPGPASDTLELAEDEIRGVTTSDIAELADYTSDIAANLRSITERLELAFNEETARNLSSAFDNFERASQELVDLLARQREGFGQFSTDLEQASSAMREAASALDATLGRLEAATEEGELEDIFENARHATASIDSMSREWLVAAREFRATLDGMGATVDTAQVLLGRLGRGEGSLGRLVQDTVLYENTAAALGELRALLDDLRKNPRKYFNFSVF